jgi:hypothetical protein
MILSKKTSFLAADMLVVNAGTVVAWEDVQQKIITSNIAELREEIARNKLDTHAEQVIALGQLKLIKAFADAASNVCNKTSESYSDSSCCDTLIGLVNKQQALAVITSDNLGDLLKSTFATVLINDLSHDKTGIVTSNSHSK